MSDHRVVPGTETYVVVDADDESLFVKPVTGFLIEWTTHRHEASSTRSFAAAQMLAREVGGRIRCTFQAETISEVYRR